MKPWLSIGIGGVVSAVAGVASHLIVERLNRKKVRQERLQSAVDDLQNEIDSLLTQIAANNPTWSLTRGITQEAFERRWEHVCRRLPREVKKEIDGIADNAIRSLSIDSAQHPTQMLRDFQNKLTTLRNQGVL